MFFVDRLIYLDLQRGKVLLRDEFIYTGCNNKLLFNRFARIFDLTESTKLFHVDRNYWFEWVWAKIQQKIVRIGFYARDEIFDGTSKKWLDWPQHWSKVQTSKRKGKEQKFYAQFDHINGLKFE